jgi:hypothetical protein
MSADQYREKTDDTELADLVADIGERLKLGGDVILRAS